MSIWMVIAFSVIVLLQYTMKWQFKHSIDMCSDVIYYDSCQKKAFYLHSPSRIIPLPTVMQQSIHILHLSVHQINTNYENSLAWTFKNLREVLHKKSHRNNISRKTKNKRTPLKLIFLIIFDKFIPILKFITNIHFYFLFFVCPLNLPFSSRNFGEMYAEFYFSTLTDCFFL